MAVDLIDMNAFVGDDDDDEESSAMRGLDSSRSTSDKAIAGMPTSETVLHTEDFLQDDTVMLRDHSDATVLINNPYNQEEKPKISLVRSNVIPDDTNDFIKTSKVWRCLSCLRLGDYSKYFNVSTQDVASRLRYTLYGHYTGMKRPTFVAESTYTGVAMQSRD